MFRHSAFGPHGDGIQGFRKSMTGSSDKQHNEIKAQAEFRRKYSEKS